MARHKLTDTRAKSAKIGWHGDGDGLWLRAQPSGGKSWVFVSIRHGVRHELGLGAYGSGALEVSLAVARDKAEEIRSILGRGGDPFKEMAERQKRVKPRTFGAVADDLIEAKAPGWRNAKHLAQWEMTLSVYAKPLRHLPVAEVTTDEVMRCLRPIWTAKPETASRVRSRIEAVLDYAKALGLREGENPARWKGHLDHILGAREQLQRGHHAAMPYRDVPAFMAKLAEAKGTSPRALEFTILTASRTGEAVGARWEEIDFEAATWTIPVGRMKAHTEHVVPLPPRAMALLRKLHDQRYRRIRLPGPGAVSAGQQHGHGHDHAPARGRALHPARLQIELPRLGRRHDRLPARAGRNGAGAQGRRCGRASLSPGHGAGEAAEADGRLGKLLRRAPQMTSSPLSRLRYRNNGDAMREVASELRRIAEEFPAHGDERMSLGLLARMIDPAAPWLLGWPKLVIKHAGKGTPKARDDRLGFFMWAHRDVLKKKSEHVLALAKEKYGACKSRAHKALASERAHAARLPDVYARHADEIRFINSLGGHGGFRTRPGPRNSGFLRTALL